MSTIPVVSSILVTSAYKTDIFDTFQSKQTPTISTSPILFTFIPLDGTTSLDITSKDIDMRISVESKDIFSDWICINDVIVSLLLWSLNLPTPPSVWHFTFLFTSIPYQSLFRSLYKETPTLVYPLSSLILNVSFSQIKVLDITFIMSTTESIFE